MVPALACYFAQPFIWPEQRQVLSFFDVNQQLLSFAKRVA